MIELLFLALTDAQFDKILAMVGEVLQSVGQGIKALFEIAQPLLIGMVALQLAYYQSKAKEARKTIVEKIELESKISQDDRSKIIKDIAENTQISEKAFETANGHNEKIAAVVEIVKTKLP